MKSAKTLKLRIKDKHAKTLLAMAREVNLVWNYCNETSHRAIREGVNCVPPLQRAAAAKKKTRPH